MGIVNGIPEGRCLQRFNETYLSRGALKVVCRDQQTAVWLRENVEILREWEGAKLQTVEQRLPKMRKSDGVDPWPAGGNGEILVRLARLNPGLTTARWTVHERQEGDGEKDTQLVLSIDEGAVPVLEGLGMRPYFGMGRGTFKLLGAKSAKTGVLHCASDGYGGDSQGW